MPRFTKGSSTQKEYFDGGHRFEHWYRDNTVYFITARCRNRTPAFESDGAKAVFWDRFDHYTKLHTFFPGVTSLLDNHYHFLGYLRDGSQLAEMMRKLHGSIAKLVNDLLEVRLLPFWVDAGHQNYFDGCIRSELQCRRAYRYTLTQSVRHGVCRDGRVYPHTRVSVELERFVGRALELDAFMTGVEYKRYSRRGRDPRR